MTKLLTVSASVLALILVVSPSTARAGAVTVKSPISITVFVPCANGGAGENVTLTGNLHVEIQFNFNSSGGGNFHVLFNPQGISGTGSVTGAKYQGTGMTQFDASFTSAVETKFNNRFDIIGQGPGNNFEVHETAHLTINANGTVTVSFDNFSVVCK
jgi:hypothetical protein